MIVIQVLGTIWANSRGLLVSHWNWKSALLSSLFRGMIFFFANMTAGLHAATGALIAEFCYRGVTSGFYGAITQSLSQVQPAWIGTGGAMVLLPLCSHSLELGVHLLRHTPKLASSLTASVCFTTVSTLFHLYAMRRGALVVQTGASSLTQDMARMPGLIIAFVSEGPLAVFRHLCTLCRLRRPQNPEQRSTC
jgi:hypothetical protein